MVAMMTVILPIGALTDRVGRKPVIITSCVGSLVLSVPAMWLIGRGSTVETVAGVAMLGLLLVMLQASVASTLPALFPAHVRYSAFAIGYNCATSLFGGTAPLVITALIASSGDHLVPGYYMAAAAALAMVPLVRMPETVGRSLRAEGPVGGDRVAVESDVSVRV